MDTNPERKTVAGIFKQVEAVPGGRLELRADRVHLTAKDLVGPAAAYAS